MFKSTIMIAIHATVLAEQTAECFLKYMYFENGQQLGTFER